MGLSEGPLLLTTFGVAFLGSGHCFGMCGGIAAMAGIPRAPAYHAGRLIGYGAIGAFAGAFGKALFVFVDRHPGWKIVILVVFLGMLGFQLGRLWGGDLSRGGRLALRLGKVRTRLAGTGGAFGYGLATALVPCGWFAYFGWIAAATGSPIGGALVFASLWAGALPALVAAAAVFRSLRNRFPGASFRRGAALILFLITVAMLGARLDGFEVAAVKSGAGELFCLPH